MAASAAVGYESTSHQDLDHTVIGSESAEFKEVIKNLSPRGRRKLIDFAKKLESPLTESISILMTGKTGSGKSTLTNGIVGTKLAEEGASITTRCTTEVLKYQTMRDKINVTVWDSPGLQDGTANQEEYLQQMVENCSKVDVTLYCIKVCETRFVRGPENPDVVAMTRLTEAFGRKFWNNSIIVLTYANTLQAFNVEWDDLSNKKKEEAYKAKIKEWEEQIKAILIEDIEVPKEVVDAIKVIPAGHYRKAKLPGFGYWLSILWFECVRTIPSKEARLSMLKINNNRLKRENDVKKDDFQKPLEQQPLIISESMIQRMMKDGGRVGFQLGQFLAGAMGGTVGAGAGAVVGALAGVLIAYFTG